MVKVHDKWFRWLIIILPALVAGYSHLAHPGTPMMKLGKLLVFLISIILICEGGRWLIRRTRVQWPSRHQRTRRLFITYGLGVLWTALLIGASTVLQRYITSGNLDTHLRIDSNVTLNNNKVYINFLGYAILNSLLNFGFILICYEVLYHYAAMRHMQKEKEVLEKEKLRVELQQLKGIVNPHFLFNNLNSLSSLIIESPVLAQSFLDELTKVFRYLLKNNEKELTTLAQELRFIRSYYHLLQTRYGKSIQIDIRIDVQHQDLLIPPLTLQLLIENAVKHNCLNKQQPLHIELSSAPGNRLLVTNGISKKEGSVESTGIGLHSINARYRMLNKPGIAIIKNEGTFVVSIPLIEGVELAAD